jgi:hypothetical protein
MTHVTEEHCARPDLMKIAIGIAHRHSPRCTGGQSQGGDGRRWHSKACESLTADIYVALVGFEKK